MIKDQGSIDGGRFLGLEATYNQAAGILQLHCDDFLTRSLTSLGIDYTKVRPASTPAVKRDMATSPSCGDVPLRSDQLRQFSGILTYAAIACRPDLAVAASPLSSTNWDNVTAYDLNAGKRAVQYIAGTLQTSPQLGLRFDRSVFDNDDEATRLICFADSDYAGDSKRADLAQGMSSCCATC